MNVLKFGGTSMGSAAVMQQVARILEATPQPLVVVVSAMSGTTDQLIQSGELAAAGDERYKDLLREIEHRHLHACKELIPVQQQSSVLSLVKKACNEMEDICNGIFLLNECSPRTRDKLMSYGELLSSQLFAAALSHSGREAAWKDARELIRTNARAGNAQVDFGVTNQQVRQFFAGQKAAITVLPGFIGSDLNGVTTTLGRGGSDYTAAIIAGAVGAEVLEIWTDVSGMMTADPRWVPNARIIPSISYQEAMELSHFGAKVLYPPTIQPVLGQGIPIRIKNTFAPEDPGTLIERASARDNIIRGISSINAIALLSLEGSGMVGIPGISARLFDALAGAGINVILITQGSSEHSICVGINTAEAAKAKEAVDHAFQLEIETGKVDPLYVETDLAIVALVGDNMKFHTGVSGRMFSSLGRNGVNIRAIAQGSTERNISAVVASRDVRKAINVLHEEFFETVKKQVHLFVTGTGNVGRRLLEQLRKQLSFLESQLRLQVRVAGIANSRHMLVDENGIALDNWEALLEQAPAASLDDFVQAVVEKNLPNSVFADITAHEVVAQVYERLLEKSIAVVACNKIAASSVYSRYKHLKELSREFNAPFLFETNVGAGLPVIGTLNDLLRSGDRVQKMEAVLSGTLNFVFNHYDGSRSFADVVRQAQEEGYTEPDPRLDLSGTDVMRKIMILAREAGVPLEMDEIVCNGFLPESCFKGSVDDFYRQMAAEESHFQGLLKEAQGAGCKLKFVARFEHNERGVHASVGLQHIAPHSDFYHLYGKDNLVLFYTDRYAEQPLVIKGAGAGAEVTASGVFADILRAV
ncbi:MAG TPA: bifunctional aspartate kinase/homoserine dehydrogenase I [Lacibacter sp.]|nr:bifunctional aspartate kinase/homoserine dehydrogenase I [Lacibacter sp.]HMO89775.1 bifunctional aspartate kinase/homoserine dehydrogenase I [Lacibacter sp.]